MDKMCNCYLITKDRFYALIDTGMGFESGTMQDRLDKLGVDKLHCIMLTHSHFDHAGNVRRLQDKYGGFVFVHSSEVRFVTGGYTYLPKGTVFPTKLLTSVIGNRITWLQRYQGCDSEIILTEEKLQEISPDILRIQILHTPGHTTGSVSFIIDNEIAIVGDTMVNMMLHLFPPFADFPELLPKVWGKLLNTNCRLYLPAHGKEIEREVLKAKHHNSKAEKTRSTM